MIAGLCAGLRDLGGTNAIGGWSSPAPAAPPRPAFSTDPSIIKLYTDLETTNEIEVNICRSRIQQAKKITQPGFFLIYS